MNQAILIFCILKSFGAHRGAYSIGRLHRPHTSNIPETAGSIQTQFHIKPQRNYEQTFVKMINEYLRNRWVNPNPISYIKKKISEKSRECHNNKPQPFPDTKRKTDKTKEAQIEQKYVKYYSLKGIGEHTFVKMILVLSSRYPQRGLRGQFIHFMNGSRGHDDPQNEVVLLIFNVKESLKIADGPSSMVIGDGGVGAKMTPSLWSYR